MKTFAQAAGIFLVFLLTIFLLAGYFSNTAMHTELENTLDNALEHALYVAMSDNVYTIDTKDKLAADVLHELFSSCNVKADYEVVFNVIDLEAGLLDVQVTQTFKRFALFKTEVVCRRTVILDSAA